MIAFENINKGQQFKFHKRTYTKIDDFTAVAIRNYEQIVKFFTKTQKVNINIKD